MDMDNAGDYSHAVCRSMRIPGAWIHGIRRGMACAAGSADDGKHGGIEVDHKPHVWDDTMRETVENGELLRLAVDYLKSKGFSVRN